MSDVEKRLKVLEKRARADDERWRMLDEQTKAFDLIRAAIFAPICAATPIILPTIIQNLRSAEKEARAERAREDDR